MSSIIFDNFSHGLQQVLNLRAQQHQITASNIANAETPGYHARHLDFESVLGEAVGASNEMNLRRTRADHFSSVGGDPNAPEIVDIEPPSWAEDGNSVIAEAETIRMTENSMLYGGVARGLSRRLSMLRFAAGDGKP